MTAVDEQRNRARQGLAREQVKSLRLAVLAYRELGLIQIRHRATGSVVDHRIDQDAGHFCFIDDLIGRQGHFVAYDGARVVFSFDDNLARFERILVSPGDGVRGAGLDGAHHRAIDEKAEVQRTRTRVELGRPLNLRDDTNRRRSPRAAQR